MHCPPTSSHLHVGRLLDAAQQLAGHLRASSRLDRGLLNAAMSTAFGATAATGAWTQRDSFIAAEIALILRLREIDLPQARAETLGTLAALAALLPTQTVRSEEQIAHQHFSTPLSLSWLAAQLAGVTPDDIVLEPSAGTGMLAQWLGQGRALHLNEIDPARAEVLRRLFPWASVSGEDAARLDPMGVRPSVIVMNPPFARNAAGGEDRLAAARHLAAAVRALCPGGRLVALMPDSFTGTGKGADIFARALQGYRVIQHIRLEGAFAAHGTSVPVRLLAIDKVPGKLTTAVIQRSSLVDLIPFLEQLPARAPLRGARPSAVAAHPLVAAKASGGLFRSIGTRAMPGRTSQHAPTAAPAPIRAKPATP